MKSVGKPPPFFHQSIEPMLPLPTSAILLFVIIFTSYVIQHLKKLSNSRPKPPGPKGWPLIGNVFDIPHKNSWLTFTEWQKTYGDIIYVESFGNPTVILNNLDDIRELLDKRSAITADRPRMVMANELMKWDWDFAHMQHSEKWRQHRKVFHQHFQQRNTPTQYPVIRKAAATLLNKFLRAPDNFRWHVRQFAGTVILKVTYDHEVKSEDDYYVTLAGKATKGLLQAVHIGSHAVDVLPILKYIPAWVPGAHFQKEAQIYARFTQDLRDIPFQQAKEGISNGSIGSCFVSDNLAKGSVNEEIIRNSAGIAFLAGSDTTVSVISTFLLAIVHYPEVQSRAQKEIDIIIGTDRLPDYDDRSSLPYIDAIISEVFRWCPPTPLALPHRWLVDDVYKGYHFQAGTNIVPNVWGIFRDEIRFPEPHKFKPERFLDAAPDLDPITMDAFGYGRRICPGRYVALNSAWLAIAQILTTFNVSAKRDEKGHPILKPPAFVSGLVVHPEDFEADFTVRSRKALELIERAALDAE